MKRFGEVLRNSKGQAMPALGIAGMALLAFAAVGIDLGRQSYTGTELQNIADAAAMSAAKATSSQSAAYSAANAIAQLNQVNGQPLTLASSDVVLGKWTGTAFSAGATPANAAQVTATKTITNLISGVIGHKTTTLNKMGVAAILGTGAETPPLPLAIGESLFNGCETAGCTLPTITDFGSDTQHHSGVTTNSPTTPATDSNVLQYFPAACGGGGASPGIKKIGDEVLASKTKDNNTVDTGLSLSILTAIKCSVCTLGMNDFIVPVVADQDNWCDPNLDFEFSTRNIQGFATLHVNSFRTTGNGNSNRTCSQNSNGDVVSFSISVKKNNNHPGAATTNNLYFGTGSARKVG